MVRARGKTVIEKIEDKTSRQVTFSKRKSGLFKKAKELAVLCDAQVGVLISSSTGRLYDYSSSSMRSLIETYQDVTEGRRLMSVSTEVKLWQTEAARLRQQVHNLQENHRKLLGQHLSGLGVEDLKGLENQLETSLHEIRLKKDQLMNDQIEQLNKKGTLMHQENMELHCKFNIIRQENMNLQNKINGRPELNEGKTNSVTQYSITVPNDANKIRLELSQPLQSEREETPGSYNCMNSSGP